MTIADLEHFRNLLLQKQESVGDWLNAGPATSSQAVERAQALMAEIKDALERVKNKTFGACQVCHDEVERYRLEVQPTTKVCLGCISPKEQQELEDELSLASKIHRALLPQSASRIDGFDVAVKSFAARAVGGDYFDFMPAGDNLMDRIIIADAMGKGVPAGLLMSNVQAALRILGEEIESPSALVTKLNRWLCRNIPVTKFVSLICVALESGRRRESRVLIANAGHCSPILVSSDGKSRALQHSGGVLGVHEDFVYDNQELVLKSGDGLFLYTDGVVEAESPSEEMFGEERLTEFLVANRATPLHQLPDLIHGELLQFIAKSELADDFTVIAIRKI